MGNYEALVKQLKSSVFTVISPELAGSAATAIQLLTERENKIVKDLKYYLDTNEENGVVYIPKFVIEKIVNGT